MADSRAYALGKKVLDSLASITGVRLWSDKSGDTDAQGVELSEFVSSDIVTGTTIDYKALTPKGFYQSVATEGRKGIVEKATDAEIEAETPDKFLDSEDQTKMRDYWGSAEDGSNVLGRPIFWHQDGIGEGETIPFAYKFTVCFNTNRATSTPYSYYPIPNAPSGYKYAILKINGIWRNILGGGVMDNTYINALSSDVTINLPSFSSSFKLVFPTDGSPIYILSSLSGRQTLSMDVYAILDTI